MREYWENAVTDTKREAGREVHMFTLRSPRGVAFGWSEKEHCTTKYAKVLLLETLGENREYTRITRKCLSVGRWGDVNKIYTRDQENVYRWEGAREKNKVHKKHQRTFIVGRCEEQTKCTREIKRMFIGGKVRGKKSTQETQENVYRRKGARREQNVHKKSRECSS